MAGMVELVVGGRNGGGKGRLNEKEPAAKAPGFTGEKKTEPWGGGGGVQFDAAENVKRLGPKGLLPKKFC